MWKIEKDFRFEAAHMLPDHDGKCRRLHGHSWVAKVKFSSEGIIKQGAKSGMVLDYGTIKSIVNPIVEEKLDHYYLNETVDVDNPTSELLAAWLFERIESVMEKREDIPGGVILDSVTIEETCTARCEYFG